MLSVYLKDGLAPPEQENVLRLLSESWAQRLLVDGNSPDPYIMTLIDGAASKQVRLDVVALDDRDEYVLATQSS
jgi:hypothetical protein